MAADPGWTLDPLQTLPPLLLAGGYWFRARELARRGRPVAVWRRISFYTGVAVLLLAVTSPIDTIGEERLFWVHMVQHLMLGDVAPLLIVLGLTGPLLRPLLQARPIQRLRFLAHPFVALPLWAVNLYTWHLAAAYEAALRHPAIHALEHGLFFTTGVLMWAAVAEPLPGPEWFGAGWKAIYTLAVRTIQAGLANVFIWSGATFYGFYETGERTAGVSPLTDQQIAGAVMFIEGAIVTLLVFAWLFLRWMQEAEIAQRLVEAGYDPARSVRSARHGGAGLLREPPPPD